MNELTCIRVASGKIWNDTLYTDLRTHIDSSSILLRNIWESACILCKGNYTVQTEPKKYNNVLGIKLNSETIRNV